MSTVEELVSPGARHSNAFYGANEPDDSQRIAEEAADWLRRLENDDRRQDVAFATWVKQSSEHMQEFLVATAIDRQLRVMGPARLRNAVTRLGPQKSATERTLYEGAASGDEDRLDQLYFRYRRPLLQVFLHRKIGREIAHDLLQRTFLQAIKKIREEGLEDPSELSGYLYKTACALAVAYWRGELPVRRDGDTKLLADLRDESISLEERLDHGVLAKCVRALMTRLPMARDREVLMRLYVHEEPRESICRSLELSDLQFNQVLWRVRQRFGEILRKYGFR